MCTGIPETAYAAEQAKETVQEVEALSFEDLEETEGERLQTEIPEDEKTSGDGENPQNETDTQDEKNPADQEVSDEDTPSGDADEAGEQEAEAPSDKDTEETEVPSDENVEETQEEELQAEVSEEEEEGLTEEEFSVESEVAEGCGEAALYAANGFVPRTTNPGNNSYYTSGNPFAGPNNCTYYAWGRAHELLGYKPYRWTGNAGNWWYNKDGYERGSTPRLGAIMCWGGGDK